MNRRPPFGRRPGQFATKHQAQNLRRHIWICQNCHERHREQKPRTCGCGSESLWYFPSTKEANRAAHLLLLQRYGQIKELQFSVPFDVKINGTKVFTYRADAVYRDNKTGLQVVEDTKASANPKSHDPVFTLKKKCVEAYYGIEIKIVTGSK